MRDHRGPDVGLEVIEPAPSAAGQTIGSLQAGDPGLDPDEIACCATEKIVHHISSRAASQYHHCRRLSKMVIRYDPNSATRIHSSRYHAVEPFPGVSEDGVNLSRQPLFFPAPGDVLHLLKPLHSGAIGGCYRKVCRLRHIDVLCVGQDFMSSYHHSPRESHTSGEA